MSKMDYKKLSDFLNKVTFVKLKQFAREHLKLNLTEIEQAENERDVYDRKFSLIRQWGELAGHEATFDHLEELFKKFASKDTSHAGYESQPSNRPSSDRSVSPTVSNYSESFGSQRLLSAGPGDPHNSCSVNKEERELLQQVHSPMSERPPRTIDENEIGLNESKNKEENSTNFNNAMPLAHEERSQDETIRPVTTVPNKASYADNSPTGQYEDAAVIPNKPDDSRTFTGDAEGAKDDYFEITSPPPSPIVVVDCPKRDASRLSKDEEYYPILDAEFKGYILIFNNVFENAPDERKGSEADVEHLKRLWKEIGGCKILDHPNLSAEDMKYEIRRFVTSKKRKPCGFVAFFIMSHGDSEYYYQESAERIGEGYIEGNDREKLMMSEILEMMKNSYPGTTLRDIPKLVFVQACRGKMLDRGVRNERIQSAVVTDKRSEKTGMASKIPETSDTLISYATQKGYKALRHESFGSWFINAIVNVFRKHASHKHVLDLMTKVNDSVSRRSGQLQSGEECKEMSEINSTLRRNLLLFPGRENEEY